MKKPATHKSDFYYIKDVASFLHVTTHTIRNLESEFGIEVKKDVTGKRVYTIEDVEKYRIIFERKNEAKDLSSLKKSSLLVSSPIKSSDNTDSLINNSVQSDYSNYDNSPVNTNNISESIVNSLKLIFNTKLSSVYSLILFISLSVISFGSFYFDNLLDLDTSLLGNSSSKSMSNVLQAANTEWDYRFDVNVPAYFNATLFASDASMNLIRVGDRVLISPQGISAPNIVNRISTIAGDEVLLVDNTDPNNPIISISDNPTFNQVSIATLNGVTALDDQTIQTIQDNLQVGDAQTLNGLADTDFLRSNADTIFSNGLMTFDVSSSLKFNNLSPNTFLRVGSDNTLIGYSINAGLNVAFDSTANSLTINVATGAASNTFNSVAVNSLFLGGTSFDFSNLILSSASEINKLHTLSGSILTSTNLTSVFPGIDTDTSNDITTSNLASSILSNFPDIDTASSNKVLISSLASLMLSNYPNLDTNASDDSNILVDAVLVNSAGGKEVYSTNIWYGNQTFTYISSNTYNVAANGRIVLNPGAVPGNTDNSLYNNGDRLYFEDLPLVQVSDHLITSNVNKISYFVTDASGRLLLQGINNVALSQIVQGSASQILGMNGGSLSYLTVNGDLTVSTTSSSNITFTFNSVNSNTGTFGSSSYIPQITVNSKGLITSVSTVAIETLTTNPNNYVTSISFSTPAFGSRTLILERDGLSNLTANFSMSASDITAALGFIPQTNLGYTPLNSTAFNSANITNALGYVPFGPTNFIAGTNVSLSSTATSLTINSSYVDTDTNNYTTSISFADSSATSKVLTLNRSGLSALTAVFSISAANVTSALGYIPFDSSNFTATQIINTLGYTPLNSTAFNSANITNALGFIPLQVSSIVAGSNITIDTTATTVTINGVVGGTNANNYVTGISFSTPEAGSRTLVLSRSGLSNLTAVFFLSASDITSALGYTPLQASSTGADKYINSFGIATSLIDENVQLNFSLGRTDLTTILATTTLTPEIITTALGYIPQEILAYTPFDSASFTSINIISALGYTPLNSTAFNSANITNALGYVPFGPTNFIAGTNVSLSSTATSLTINSSYVDTDTNNYTTSISFADSSATSKVLTLNRSGLSALTAVFSISAANVTSALGYIPQVNLGYTPLRNTSDTLSGNLTITGTLSANQLFQNGYGVCDISGNCAGLGGTILGSGNAGYLSYFTASNSIANSNIFQSSANGYIGIGTTNPGEMLDVFGAIKLSQNMGTSARNNAIYQDGGTLYWNGQVVGVVGSTNPGGISGTKDYFPYFNTKDTLIASDFKYISSATDRGLELVVQDKLPVYVGIGHQNQAKFKIGVSADSTGYFSPYDSEDDVVLVNSSNLSTSDTIFSNQNEDGRFIFTFGTNSVERRAVTFDYVNSTNLVHVGINTTLPLYALQVTGDSKISGTMAVPTFSNPSTGSLTFLSGGNFSGNLSGANGYFTNISLANALPVIFGGTGLTALPTAGQLLIGNGTGYTLATLTAGSNVSISTTAGGITISSSYVDTTNANNYVSGISFSTPATGSRTLVLSREGLIDLTATFSLSSSDITSALGYTPLRATDTAADSFVNTFGIATNLVNQNVQFNFSLGRNDSTTILATQTLTPEIITTALGYIPQTNLGYTPLKNTTDTLTGNLGVSGSFSSANAYVTGQIYGPLTLKISTGIGSVGSPGFAFNGYSSTGLYYNTADTSLRISVNGTNSAYFKSNGLVINGNLSASSANLSGNFTAVTGNLTSLSLANALPVIFGGTGLTALPTAGQLLIGNGTGYTLATLTAGTNVSISTGAGSITITSTDTDTNNYATDVLFSTPQAGTRDIKIARLGLSTLSASFTLDASDITSALSYTPFNSASFNSANIISVLTYTPLKNTTDTFTGDLTLTGKLSAANGYFSGTLSTDTLWVGEGASVFTSDDYLYLDNFNGIKFRGANASAFEFYEFGTSLVAKFDTTGSVINGNLSAADGTFNNLNLTNALTVGNGGTGLTALPTAGQLLIGNGTGYTLATLTAGTNVSISTGAGSIEIASTDTDTNNYATDVLFSTPQVGTRDIKIARLGLSTLSASFTLDASDITSALSYTPLKNTTDVLTGNLGVSGNFSAANITTSHLYVNDYLSSNYNLKLESEVNSLNRTLRFDIGSTLLSNTTFGLNLQSVYFTTPSNATVKNLTFNHMSANNDLVIDLFKSGTLPSIYNNKLDTFGSDLSAAIGFFNTVAAGSFSNPSNTNIAVLLNSGKTFNINGLFSAGNSTLGNTTINGNLSASFGFFNTVASATFSNPLGGVFTFLTGANFNGNISAANGTFITLSAQSLNINNLFTVNSDGSVFNNNVSFNDAVEFNAVGDLAVAYDLVFTNTSYSKLKSANDLYLEAGEPFNSSNMYLTTYNNGNINLSANSVNIVSGNFSAGNSTLGATTINGNLSAATGFFNSLAVGTFSNPSNTNLAVLLNSGRTFNVNALFSAGNSTLGTTTIIGNILGNNTSTMAARVFSNPGAGNSAPFVRVGATTYSMTTSAVSDLRLKSNIQDFSNALSIVTALKPVSYNMKDMQDLESGITNPVRSVGLIAQEVSQVIPNLVGNTVEINGENYLGIDYGMFTPFIIGAVKEQQSQINNLSNSVATLNVGTMQTLYDNFMNTIDNLSMSTENGSLVVNTDLTVTGRSLFNDASFTGDVTIGQMKFDSLNNDISINGASCVNIDGTLNTALCDTQSLYLMKNKAGNLNIFDGKVVINPNGEMIIEKIQAGEVAAAKVKASEYEVVAGSEVSGNSNMLSGQTEITILTSKVKSNSKIFVTANNNLEGKSIYVSNKVEGVSFTVKLNGTVSSDVNFDWFILNIE